MRKLLVVLAVLLVGCSESVAGPETPADTFYNRRPLTPVPTPYAGFYADVETCLGLTGDFAAVDWFLADSITLANETSHVGHLSLPDEITMVAQFAPNEWAVRIYMIQHVTQADSVRHADQRCLSG